MVEIDKGEGEGERENFKKGQLQAEGAREKVNTILREEGVEGRKDM